MRLIRGRWRPRPSHRRPDKVPAAHGPLSAAGVGRAQIAFEQYGCRLLVAVIAVGGVTGHLHDLDGLLEAMHKGLTVKI